MNAINKMNLFNISNQNSGQVATSKGTDSERVISDVYVGSYQGRNERGGDVTPGELVVGVAKGAAGC